MYAFCYVQLERQCEAAQAELVSLRRQLEAAQSAVAQLQSKHDVLRGNFVTLHRTAAHKLAERDATIRRLTDRLVG